MPDIFLAPCAFDLWALYLARISSDTNHLSGEKMTYFILTLSIFNGA
jgi:hypothetical protein